MNPAGKQGSLCSRELACCVGLWNWEGRPVVFIATHPVGAVCLPCPQLCHQKSMGSSHQSPSCPQPTTRDNALPAQVFPRTRFPDPMLQSSAESHTPVTLTSLCHLYSLRPVPQFQPLPHFLTPLPRTQSSSAPSSESLPGLSLAFSLLRLCVHCSALFLSILPAKLRKDFFFPPDKPQTVAQKDH